jgi:hypothetical protein
LASGITPDGDPYNCPLDITRNGDLYDLYWNCGASSKYYGVGFLRGNIVSVALARRTRRCNVFSYVIEEDGTLDGIWASFGSSEIGTDVATPETSE